MTDLEQIAAQTLSLDTLAPADDELALVQLLHTIVGPRLAALAACDITLLAAEPDLDPGRAPHAP